MVERALFRSGPRLIDLKDLPEVLSNRGTPFQGEDVPSSPDSIPLNAGMSLAEVEKVHIERVLALCKWNRSAAAKILQIDRRTLFSKIQRYGLVGPLRGDLRGTSCARSPIPSKYTK
jgi:DNA-binding NtrC family response regulator